MAAYRVMNTPGGIRAVLTRHIEVESSRCTRRSLPIIGVGVIHVASAQQTVRVFTAADHTSVVRVAPKAPGCSSDPDRHRLHADTETWRIVEARRLVSCRTAWRCTPTC